jgi:dienelactone hydrolase
MYITMLLLILLLLLEVVLAVYRIKTHSMQQRQTAVLRTAFLLVLITLCTLSVLTWGFRYYALSAVLVISAVVNAARFLNKMVTATKLQPTRIILKTVGMSALLIISMIPAIIFPEYRPLPTTGEYQVVTTTRYLCDESRIETYAKHDGARTLVAEFWYPSDAKGNFPLVVFSHGSFGTRTSNETLYRELASHGYVVCSIDHTYQCFYTTDKSGNVLLMSSEFMGEILSENAKEDKQKSLELYRKWMDVRVGDINFVIDTIKADSDILYGLINTDKIGVIGHSLGGSAALGIGRMRSDIGAVVALEAPFMCDILDIENDEFVFESTAYPVPVLNVYSDSLWTHLAKWPQYEKNVHLLSGSEKDAYSLHIAGVGHLSLTDLSLASPILTRILNGHAASVSAEDCLRLINKECLAFFDCYLKGIGAFSLN